jgi:chorismate synthase
LSSSFGRKIKVQIFGQSHSDLLGVVIDGLPANHYLDFPAINAFLQRRRGGQNAFSTKRAEDDIPQIVSGVVDGKTCGAPLCAVFANTDISSADYEQLRFIPRPSHADYNAFVKYGGANDVRGGGHFSGRLTLPLCFAGAVCKQLLSERHIYIGAHIGRIGHVCDTPCDPVNISADDIVYAGFPVNDAAAGEEMVKVMIAAAEAGDSIGGIVECAVLGLPQGVGEPMFAGLENMISAAVFSVPAVKGIEFGSGFAAAGMRGSEHNDEYYIKDGGIKHKTNHAGGILGGMSTGMPLIFRVAIKPTPSIFQEQNSVNIKTMENVKLQIKGRHDPSIVPRAVPCIEAAAAIAVIDLLEG